MLYLLESEGFYMEEEKKEVLAEEGIKEEPVVEETPVEEKQEPVREETNNEISGNAVAIEKPNTDDVPYDQAIETARLNFHKYFKKGRNRSYIIMAIVMVVAVASVILVTQQNMALKITGWSLVGAALVGMIVYYIVTRNSMPNATKDYIALVNKELNQRNFKDTRMVDVTVDPKEKIDLSDVMTDAVFKGVNNIASRNVINGKFKDRSFRVGDLGLYSGAGRNRTSCFVGKYLSYPNDLHFENRIVITKKGKNPVDLPSDIEDLAVLLEEENLFIYGKEGLKYESILGKEFVANIKNLEVDGSLLGFTIVIWGGHSAAYFSYDDTVMSLPFEKEFKAAPNEKYANDLIVLLENFSSLLK